MFASQCLANEQDQKWRQGVEEILSNIVIGPLNKDFKPESMGKRDMKSVLNAQKHRLRAHIIGHMFRSPHSFVKVCPLDDSTPEAIKELVDEFKNHSFDIHWIPSNCECNKKHGGFIFGAIPPPQE